MGSGAIPSPKHRVRRRRRGNLEDLSRQKRRYSQMPHRVWAKVKQGSNPARAHCQDEYAGRESRQDRRSKLRTAEASRSNDSSGSCGCERVRKEKSSSRPEQLSTSAEPMRTEDRQAHRAFREIEHHGGGAECRAEAQPNENDRKRLQGERYRSEVQRNRDVCTYRDKGCRRDGQKRLACERAANLPEVLSGVELGREGGLHGQSFQGCAEKGRIQRRNSDGNAWAQNMAKGSPWCKAMYQDKNTKR